MSKLKHKPGPWIAVQDGNDHNIETADGKSILAKMDYYTDQDHANALLMAAAPDLLDACVLALSAFKNHWCIDWGDLERAVSKAKGEVSNGPG